MKVYRLLKERGGTNPRYPEAIATRTVATIIVADDTRHEVVQAAWSYAVRYTAKGLDVPDYDAAVKLMLSRHPSWRIENVHVAEVWYDPAVAENDSPD